MQPPRYGLHQLMQSVRCPTVYIMLKHSIAARQSYNKRHKISPEEGIAKQAAKGLRRGPEEFGIPERAQPREHALVAKINDELARCEVARREVESVNIPVYFKLENNVVTYRVECVNCVFRNLYVNLPIAGRERRHTLAEIGHYFFDFGPNVDVLNRVFCAAETQRVMFVNYKQRAEMIAQSMKHWFGDSWYSEGVHSIPLEDLTETKSARYNFSHIKSVVIQLPENPKAPGVYRPHLCYYTDLLEILGSVCGGAESGHEDYRLRRTRTKMYIWSERHPISAKDVDAVGKLTPLDAVLPKDDDKNEVEAEPNPLAKAKAYHFGAPSVAASMEIDAKPIATPWPAAQRDPLDVDNSEDSDFPEY